MSHSYGPWFASILHLVILLKPHPTHTLIEVPNSGSGASGTSFHSGFGAVIFSQDCTRKKHRQRHIEGIQTPSFKSDDGARARGEGLDHSQSADTLYGNQGLFNDIRRMHKPAACITHWSPCPPYSRPSRADLCVCYSPRSPVRGASWAHGTCA